MIVTFQNRTQNKQRKRVPDEELAPRPFDSSSPLLLVGSVKKIFFDSTRKSELEESKLRARAWQSVFGLMTDEQQRQLRIGW